MPRRRQGLAAMPSPWFQGRRSRCLLGSCAAAPDRESPPLPRFVRVSRRAVANRPFGRRRRRHSGPQRAASASWQQLGADLCGKAEAAPLHRWMSAAAAGFFRASAGLTARSAGPERRSGRSMLEVSASAGWALARHEPPSRRDPAKAGSFRSCRIPRSLPLVGSRSYGSANGRGRTACLKTGSRTN